jgi:phage-related protein
LSKNIIINFVLFQIAWFACVIGAAKQMPWLGVIVTFIIVAWHLMQAKPAKPEIILLLIVLIIGAAFDQLMLTSNLITYQVHGWSDSLVPAWILALWAGFVTALNISLRWMRGKWLVMVLFGAIGGPLAYMGAEKLGAVTLNSMPASYLALAAGWAILTPLLLKLAEKFDGFKAHV